MKNRTMVGILCMLLAVVLTFVVSPVVSKITTDTVKVPRLCKDVEQGSKIQKANIETVSVSKSSLPKGVITEENQIIGKYASANLFAGDYITLGKVRVQSNSADDVISGFNGSKFAMSFTIDSFAAGLSGKIQNGDIISLVVKDKNGKAIMPASFKYVKVITTTTSGGIDQDKIVKNDDGSFEPPATITLLVNAIQAQLLADYEEGTISCVLVYRGSAENAQKFLDTQDEYFASGAATQTASEETDNG